MLGKPTSREMQNLHMDIKKLRQIINIKLVINRGDPPSPAAPPTIVLALWGKSLYRDISKLRQIINVK